VSEPIPVHVTRYRCPHCARSASSKGRSREHIARCWRNPEAKGCKTCKHFDNTYDYGDDCNVGVDLAGRPACAACAGRGAVLGDELGASECPECGGDGAAIRPGPITNCEKWEAS
jgi:hypothetical protein